MNDWIDRHSVTCVLCGGLADERETLKLWEDQIEGFGAAPSLDVIETKRQIIEEQGQGEAHTECFDYAIEHGVQEALEELEARDHR